MDKVLGAVVDTMVESSNIDVAATESFVEYTVDMIGCIVLMLVTSEMAVERPGLRDEYGERVCSSVVASGVEVREEYSECRVVASVGDTGTVPNVAVVRTSILKEFELVVTDSTVGVMV